MLRLHRTAATAVALTLPAAAAADDLRTPDAIDAGTPTPVQQDLRTPDAVEGTGTRAATEAAPARATGTSQDGFDWGDAGIGAAGGVGLVVLGVGAVMASGHQRRRAQMPVA